MKKTVSEEEIAAWVQQPPVRFGLPATQRALVLGQENSMCTPPVET